MTYDYPELEVCVDCTFALANAEFPLTDSGELDADFIARYDAGLARLGEVVLSCPEDCEGHFSWKACDVCGSTLGGDRHPAAIIR